MEAKENTNNKLPQRKSPRAQWLEYNEGTYFVTVCTNERQHSFGEIRDGRMGMTGIGLFLVNELEHISLHHSHINVLQYVVMPNHFHAIIEIVGTQRAASANVNPTIPDIAHGTDAARRADAVCSVHLFDDLNGRMGHTRRTLHAASLQAMPIRFRHQRRVRITKRLSLLRQRRHRKPGTWRMESAEGGRDLEAERLHDCSAWTNRRVLRVKAKSESRHTLLTK